MQKLASVSKFLSIKLINPFCSDRYCHSVLQCFYKLLFGFHRFHSDPSSWKLFQVQFTSVWCFSKVVQTLQVRRVECLKRFEPQQGEIHPAETRSGRRTAETQSERQKSHEILKTDVKTFKVKLHEWKISVITHRDDEIYIMWMKTKQDKGQKMCS